MPAPEATELSRQFLSYIQARGRELREGDQPPASRAAWETQKGQLKRKLLAAWGGFPDEPCPLEPRQLGVLERDGYRVEKIIFQTRPGIWMTANAYVPSGEGRHPAVLCVHGHWAGAKQDPVVQARCLGLVKLGFFVLCVDAFGAGERGLQKALGEYHGEMVSATLFPVGLPLSGLQVYENMRAVDYLQTRPEVDPQKIGITGASGGGNQTMYAGAFDVRFGCVVPTCSVGTYQAYLGAACCMCEVVPGAVTFTAEAGLLAMVAPRGLMIISATKDAFQFSVGEAQKSIAAARPVFDLYEQGEALKHAVFESPHAYNQPMREAMYGWMTLHLKGEGTGEPIAEPAHQTEEPEALRCFPGESRPDDWVTIPRFAAAAGRQILANRQIPDHLEHWEAAALGMKQALLNKVLGPQPPRTPLNLQTAEATTEEPRTQQFETEPGVTLIAHYEPGSASDKLLAIVLDLDGATAARGNDMTKALKESGWHVVTCDLRATGHSSVAGDIVRRAPDHNSAECPLWTGRPLLGQWAWDVSRLLDALGADDRLPSSGAAVIGIGGAGLVAVCAGVADARVTRVVSSGSLVSYLSDVPYEQQRLGIMVPRVVRDVGDVPQLAALLAPRPVLIAGAVTGAAAVVPAEQLTAQYAYARQVYRLLEADERLVVTADAVPARVLRFLQG